VGNGGQGMKQLKENPERYLPFTLGMELMKDSKSIVKAASKHYFGTNQDYENQLNQFEQVNDK